MSSSTAIPFAKLGESASVSRIGFGLMGIAIGVYGGTDSDEERLKVLDAAYSTGSRFWDTANVYGDSEELIGKWFKANPEKRNDIFLATKFGLTELGARGDPEYVKEQCDLSLKKLGVEYIDLFYQHRVDANTPIEKTVGALAELVKEGKIKNIGLSECTPNGLRRASKIHHIAAIEIEYSPVSLDTEHKPFDLIQTARELGTKIVAYSPLGRGLLTGQITSYDQLGAEDFRRTLPRFSEQNFPKILDLAKTIGQVGDNHKATPGQAVLAWILAQGDDFFVIPGTRKVKYLEENAGAASVKLTSEEIATIRKQAEAADVSGDRYGPGWNDMLYVDSPEL